MTYEHKFKHTQCGVHFTVYSWNEDWPENGGPTCPECGHDQGAFLYWREATTRQIFNAVPGGSPMVGIIGAEVEA